MAAVRVTRRGSRCICDAWAPHCDNPVTVEHPRIHWLADPAVLAPIALLVFVYVRRFLAVRREDGPRGASAVHALAFAGAVLALLAALVSPIDALGEEYL